MHFKSWSMSAFLKGRQPALTCFFYPNYSETSFTYDHVLDLYLPCSCSSLYWLSFQLALQSCFIDIPVLPSQPCFTDDPAIASVFPLVSCGLLKASQVLREKILENLLDKFEFIKIFCSLYHKCIWS